MRYEFKREDAFGFARHLGITVKERGAELQFVTCPYCRGGANGRDKGTFSINLENDGLFKCLRASCNRKGNMWQLAKDFDYKLTDDFSRFYEKKPTFRKLTQPKQKIEVKEKVQTFLEKRGISKKTAEKYQVTSRNDNPDILCFPVFNEDKELVNIKYRNTKYAKGDKGNKEWFEPNCMPYLYGVNTWNGKYDSMVITEGQLDCMACYESGVENAFSVLGGKNSYTWYPASCNFIDKFAEIVIFGDCERDEITLVDGIKARYKGKIRVVNKKDYRECKDANEILLKFGKEAVKNCVDKAETLPMSMVKELADVESIDINKVVKCPTGIRQADKLLKGGIPFGGVSLITGKCGEGKSVLASQILINALAKGFSCFAYSGELQAGHFRAIMDFQVAGKQHLFETINSWGERDFGLSAPNRNLISNWYRGRMLIYDDSNIDENETESLVKIIRRVIIQRGVQVILLDNLMTAIDLVETVGEDKYERQSKFVKELARIAKAFSVLIILVAHKRKNNFSGNENDEVMGSSDITNLAMITLSYSKSDEIKDTQRLLKISKNRLFGKTNVDGFVLDFDESSRRIYGDGDNVNVNYGFDPDEKRDTKPTINFNIEEINQEETPFN